MATGEDKRFSSTASRSIIANLQLAEKSLWDAFLIQYIRSITCRQQSKNLGHSLIVMLHAQEAGGLCVELSLKSIFCHSNRSNTRFRFAPGTHAKKD